MSEPMRIELPIVRVTVFEDRAEVTRAGDVELPAGASLVALPLTPLAHEERATAHLTLEGEEALVDDLKIIRRWVEREGDDPAPAKALLLEVEEHDHRVAAAEAARARADERRATLEATMLRFVAHVGRNLARGDEKLAAASGGLAAFENELARLDEERARLRDAAAAASREAARLRGLLAPRADRESRFAAEAHLRVTSSGGRAHLTLAYVVPCGLWRPTHEAQLREDGRVRWTTHATVWQRTGEDWRDVALTLSTARPSAGASLPELTADTLRLRTKTQEERKQIIVEHRDETISKSDLAGAAPGVYDGGEPRVFTASERVSLPSDGRPHKVALESFTSEATLLRVAMPEIAEQVFLRATLVNGLDRPLLAGPVTLVMGGDYVGTGDVPYVGPREEVDVAFGSDDRFLVRLKRRRVKEDRLLGLAKERIHYVTEVSLSYSGEGQGEVTLHLRFPKSELKQLKVVPSEAHCSEGVPLPDEHGIVKLPICVAPGAWRKVELGFSFETSGDVHVPAPW